ncbi:MAG TPA: hypothetical protein P5538_08100 [Bacteroidales bacterium]|nr:hypothetical protein [Bacteroidales bacterium]HRT80883.1 hypothetical protein [Bacteroidales bacterium]
MSLKTLFILLSSFVFLTFYSCNQKDKKSTKQDANLNTDTIEIVKINYPKDSTQDQIAALLGGDYADAFKKVFTDNMSFWNEYKTSIDTPWSRITAERFTKMEKWCSDEITPKISDTTLLFYPFSGPGFINAYYLFPNANEYILVAMEKLGTIPNLYEMKEDDLKNYLDAVNFGLRDIYKRSYFITGNMDQDLRKNKVDGVLPLLYVFLHRTGHEIYEFGYYRLENDATTFTKIEKPSNDLKVTECIKFKICKKGDNKLKNLTYFYADISDDGFVKNPIFLQYLKSLRPYNVFIKSASYLSHYDTFSNIRNLVIEKSKAVLQDDTGVPFRYFKNNFDFYLYGIYEKPIDDFKSTYLFQKDLDEEYKKGIAKPLEFSLGYHWRSGKQNWVLYVRNDEKTNTTK